MLLFDDVGSYPLPQGVKKEWVEESISRGTNKKDVMDITKKAFLDKIYAGVDIPTYPQFRDMVTPFIKKIQENEERPFVIREEDAILEEVEIIRAISKDVSERVNKRIRLKVCVTGPIEIYLKEFGSKSYFDVLKNIARSVQRFVKNSIISNKFCYTDTISIDEPSIGINPELNFTKDEIVDALEIATNGIEVDNTEIHLHSSIEYRMMCLIKNIDVIGIECAKDISILKTIDKAYLKEHEKNLRVGIARTDISSLIAEVNEQYNVNAWMDERYLDKIFEKESVDRISQRLKYAYNILGDIIKYTGPDCGLGSWPSQDMAYRLLNNVRHAIDLFDTK